jgi:PAS domain S-box-containing protein
MMRRMSMNCEKNKCNNPEKDKKSTFKKFNKTFFDNIYHLTKEKKYALKILGIYLLISEIWVVTSNIFMKFIFKDMTVRISYYIIKESAYVILSSIIIYLLTYNAILKITDLKQKNRDGVKDKIKNILLESEDWYSSFIEHSPYAIYVHDNHKIIFANEAGIRLLGLLKEEDVLGKSIITFIHPNYYGKAQKRIHTVLNEKRSVPLEESKFVSSGGEEIDVEVSSNILNIGDRHAIVSFARDISERKKVEEYLRKMMEENKELFHKTIENERMKTELFSNVSHELKTPLNVILGVVQILNNYKEKYIDELEGEKIAKYINVMRQNCYRLLRLINNVIDINKIDLGFYKINPGNYDIVNVIEGITLSVAEFAKEKGINIVFDTEIEERIMAFDPDKIERIMLNLLSNAIKYTDDGGSIFVNIYDRIKKIIISVKDTGKGIPKDKLQTIFNRFERIESSTTKYREGSGIGLSLVKSLVEMHGGKISVKSQYEVETEFFIELPVKILDKQFVGTSGNDYCFDGHVERINVEFSDIYN